MRNNRDRIFIIKSINYSEADKIITVFGQKRGKFSILAKGVRKINSKNRGNIQTFSIADISYYQGSGMPILLESSQVFSVDYESINTDNIHRILVLLNKLTAEDVPNEKIFDSLEAIVNRSGDIESVNKFRTLFLLYEGLLGDMGVCSICQNTQDLYINNSLITICKDCIKKGNLDNRNFLKGDKEIYSNNKYTNLLDNYIKRIIEEGV